jgi:hypothetical protein
MVRAMSDMNKLELSSRVMEWNLFLMARSSIHGNGIETQESNLLNLQ